MGCSDRSKVFQQHYFKTGHDGMGFKPRLTNIVIGLVAAFITQLVFSLHAAALQNKSAPSVSVPPISVFGTLPEIEDASISPDGKTVALLENLGDNTVIRFFDVANGRLENAMRIGEVKARGLRWANNDQILLLVSATQKINTGSALRDFEIWRYAVIGRDLKVTYLLAKGVDKNYTGSGTIIHMLPEEPNYILMHHYNADILKVNLKTGFGKKVKSSRGSGKDTYSVGWVFDKTGDPYLRIDYKSKGKKEFKTINVKQKGKKTYKKLTDITIDDENGISFLGIIDETKAVVSTRKGANTLGIYSYDLEKAVLGETIFKNEIYDVSSIGIPNGELISVSYIADIKETVYFNRDRQGLVKSLSKAIPGARINVNSISNDNDVAIIYASYTDRPPEYYLFENATRTLSILGPTYSSLGKSNSGKRQTYNYTTDDGMEIFGYLTVPSDIKSMKGLPLIVLPHGGPEARDTLEFDWWASAYASRGYLVYQPNFRGSEGYGYSFMKAGWGEWGKKMQADITDGVKKLISDGIVNPQRICIVGASYGGYAALAGAVFTPDMYKCAVSVNGVSDLIIMMGTESQFGSVGYWSKRIGDRFKEKAKIQSVSPRLNVGNIKAPIMLLHGKDDTVVPYGQSKIMNEALQDAGKNVTFITLAGEDHWLSKTATRTNMLEASIQFIEQHIGQ